MNKLLNTFGIILAPIAVLAFLVAGFIGPGGVIALAEWPFGAGPFSTSGSYCTQMHRFAGDVSLVTNNPSSANVSNLTNAFDKLLKSAPNQTVVDDLNTWLSAEQVGDKQLVSDAAGTLNKWISASCSSPAYKIPYEINQIYSGFLGVF